MAKFQNKHPWEWVLSESITIAKCKNYQELQRPCCTEPPPSSHWKGSRCNEEHPLCVPDIHPEHRTPCECEEREVWGNHDKLVQKLGAIKFLCEGAWRHLHEAPPGILWGSVRQKNNKDFFRVFVLFNFLLFYWIRPMNDLFWK